MVLPRVRFLLRSWPGSRAFLAVPFHCHHHHHSYYYLNHYSTTPIRCMAGHNKWSKIRHKKGAKDVQRAKILGKASRAITVAVRLAGKDLDDFRVQAALQNAKAVQLPKDRIQEAIQKGTAAKSKGGGGSEDYETLRFDAMMRLTTAAASTIITATRGEANTTDKNDTATTSYQVACIITALSDNRNRTTQNVRHIVTKAGGELLATDTLNYLFERVGVILVVQQSNDSDNDQQEEDEWEVNLLECTLGAGAVNVEELADDPGDDDGGGDIAMDHTSVQPVKTFVVTTEERDLWQVVQALKEANFHVTQFQHQYIVQDEVHGIVELSPAAWQQLDDFLDKLEEDDDVDNIYHNGNPIHF